MDLSIFDIAKGISWTEEKRIYITLKDTKYELLCEYLSGFDLLCITEEIESLKKTEQVLNTNNKETIENHFITNLHGFDQDGVLAYVGGATDFSVKLLYNSKKNSFLLKHVYGNPNEWFDIDVHVLIKVLQDLKNVFITIQGKN